MDCRLLPDQDPEEWLTEVKQVLGENVEVEVLMGFTPAISTKETDLYRILEEVTLEGFPDSSILPRLQGGFTDSHFFRDLGIVCYGYVPTATPKEDQGGVHGNNERITEQNFRQGVELTIKILERFAANKKVLKD